MTNAKTAYLYSEEHRENCTARLRAKVEDGILVACKNGLK